MQLRPSFLLIIGYLLFTFSIYSIRIYNTLRAKHPFKTVLVFVFSPDIDEVEYVSQNLCQNRLRCD